MMAARFWRSVKYTPMKQLAHRAALIAKRRTMVVASRYFRSLATHRPDAPSLSPKVLPPPCRQVQNGTVRAVDGGYAFSFLNVERLFDMPIAWHRDDLNAGTRLWKLHLHYFDYTEPLDDKAFQELVDDWIGQNWPYRSGYWLDSWNSYAISIRVVAWMGEYERRCHRLDTGFLTTLRNSIYEQLQFLKANLERDVGGNHLIKNVKALYWGGRFFAGNTAEHYCAMADRLLARELGTQILSDGFHFEVSPAYHCQVFGDLLDCWRLMPEAGLRTLLGAKLRVMAQVTADLTHPDGMISLFNDGGLTMAIRSDVLLDDYTSLFGMRPKPRDRAHFPQAGYHVVRMDDFYLVCDAGRVGPDGLPAHAHGDIFAFELTIRKQRIIVDCGVFEYNAGARRSRSRATVSHNTLTLDDQDQCEFWSAFRMGRRANVRVNASGIVDGKMIIDAEHDGYAYLRGAPIHRRVTTIDLSGNLTVRDVVRNGDGYHAVSRLLLHPSVEIIPNGAGRMLLCSGDAKIELDSGRISTRIVSAPWWPDFGQEIETKQILLDYGHAPGEWEYKISMIAH